MSTDSAAQIMSWIRHDLYWSLDQGGVPSIGFLHSCDYTWIPHNFIQHTQLIEP